MAALPKPTTSCCVRRSLRWTYAVTKLQTSFLAFSYARKYGLNIVVVRLFNTSGEPDWSLRHGGAQLRQQAVRNEPLTVYGEATRPLFLRRTRYGGGAGSPRRLPGAWGEVVNVGNDQEISIRGLPG